jgi:hypothetical protein
MTVTCAYGNSDDDGGRWRCIPNTHRNKAMTSHHHITIHRTGEQTTDKVRER